MPPTSTSPTSIHERGWARSCAAWLPVALGLMLAGCGFDRGDRWQKPLAGRTICDVGSTRCQNSVLQRCVTNADSRGWKDVEDCSSEHKVCAPLLGACTECIPGQTGCQAQNVVNCGSDGRTETIVKTCDVTQGLACRGGNCENLCSSAQLKRSNVGCEYWAVDLDNADVGATLNAAAQQYAVVVSNAQPDVPATVTIEQDDSAPGTPNKPYVIASATIAPLNLNVFKLGPREVDGSAPGTFNTGTNTALSRNAYRIRASVPVVAFQFNPLDNVNVFSNDASLLRPTEAVSNDQPGMQDAYVALGWPQTIAATDDPNTNFDPHSPINLRAFLTIVGTEDKTHVQIRTAAAIVPGGPVATTPAGGSVEATLGPFDVLNLETGSFNADFTGSLVRSDGPIVVFSGNEASDAPFFQKLSERQCCADHLEEQLDPIRTAGKHFIGTVSANRTAAVARAGSAIGVVDQPEYFRVVAVTDAGARVETTLSEGPTHIELSGKGSFADITSSHHFELTSDAPVLFGSVSPSQDAAKVPRGLPGGDPSLVSIPPIEQFRTNYVFLTPDKYAFDFVRIIAPTAAKIAFDREPIAGLEGCSIDPADGIPNGDRTAPPDYIVYTCQLSFPVIDPNAVAPNNVSPGRQNDGVHIIESDLPVGALVDGFDSYVSYGYAAGTDLELIVPPG